MSSPNLQEGAFITSINGRRCTAIPRSDAARESTTRTTSTAAQQTVVSTEALETTSTIRTTSSSPPPPPPPPTTTTQLPPPPPPPTTSTTLLQETTSTAVIALPIEQTSIVAEPPLATQVPIIPTFPPARPAQGAVQPPVDVPEQALPATRQITTIPSPSVQIPPASPTSTIPPLTSIPAVSQISDSQPPAVRESQTNEGNQNAAPTSQSDGTDSNPENAPSPTRDPPALFTTIGLAPGTAAGDSAAATGGAGPQISLVPQQSNGNGAPAVVIAGSVVGALALISIIGFLLWFWRKRILKKRRSTLLTPLSVSPRFNGDSEKSYVIDRESLGPTPRSAKLKAALGYNLNRFRGQVGGFVAKRGEGSPSVNMNRGNSQFMDPVATHSRNSSAASHRTGPRDVVTTKDRFKDWWERLTADISFNWRLKNDRNAESDPFAAARDVKEKKATLGSQPDFLTLLGMDDREVEREAQRRRLSRNNKGSGSSTDHFLGSLGLSFDTTNADPFADSNSSAHNSAKPAPLVVVNPSNPFSDKNAISAPGAAVKPATTYVAEVRRSRGQSIGGVGTSTRPPSNMPYTPSRMDSMYRESLQSVESFSTRRNKFRSDPFDLERPGLLASSRPPVTSSNFSTAGSSVAPRLSSNTSGTTERNSNIRKPGNAHTRAESFSSKYSSGVSLDGWSDPGPDVGPAASRWDAESPTSGWRPGEQERPKKGTRQSGQSQTSVGKAL